MMITELRKRIHIVNVLTYSIFRNVTFLEVHVQSTNVNEQALVR